MDINNLNSTQKFDNAETKQVAKYLYVIVIASLIINPIHSLVLYYSLSTPILPLVANGLLFFIQTISIFLLSKQQVKNAAIFNLIGGWFYFSYSTFILGGANSPAILGFFIVVLMAGLLLNNRWTYFFTALTILYAVFVFFIEIFNRLPESIIEISPLYAWGTFVFAVLILVIIYELSTEKLNIALEATRQNVEALHEKNKLLEEAQEALQQNLSELSRTESALRLSQKHLQTVVQSAPVILWTSDIEGKMTLLEGKTLSSIKIRANQFQGESIFDALGERVQGLEAKIKNVLQGETVVSIENLRDRIFEIHFSPLFEDGTVNGVMGVAIDITERTQAQDAMIYLQKTESLGVLAGGIAHDFNNLLVGILGQASVGLYKMEDSHPARNHIAKAILAAEKAGSLTNQLLAYSGRERFEIKSLDLNKLVQENINLFQTTLSKNVTFKILLHNNPLIIDGDVAQLQQVIMNLIINGAEAIGQKPGDMKIQTFAKIIDTVSNQKDWAGNPLPPGHYAGLEITDTGSGMSSDILRKIFDPFFTTKNSGHGLGLAAVQGIVKGHSGRLFVSSTQNVGTTFQVLLPITCRNVDPLSELKSPLVDLSAHLSTILQIDDEPSVCEALTDILSTQGISVLSGQSREQGLSIFQQNHQKIDLVILDMTMPGVSLKSIIDDIKNIDPKVSIILSSGFDRDEASCQIDSKLILGFISKPYSVDLFISQLVHLLGIEPAENNED